MIKNSCVLKRLLRRSQHNKLALLQWVPMVSLSSQRIDTHPLFSWEKAAFWVCTYTPLTRPECGRPYFFSRECGLFENDLLILFPERTKARRSERETKHISFWKNLIKRSTPWDEQIVITSYQSSESMLIYCIDQMFSCDCIWSRVTKYFHKPYGRTFFLIEWRYCIIWAQILSFK